MTAADMTNATPISREQCKELVLLAIDRIKAADQNYRATELDATSTPKTRARMKEFRDATEVEFSWQWRNVERLLREES